MPIFAYRCNACGFEKDVLQKRSDPPLDTCPACGAAAFQKRLTAPAFQLKGSGWYVTDFRDNGGKPKGADAADKPAGETAAPADAAGAPAAAPAPVATAAAPAPASAPAPAPAPAAGA
jgi:putative FmdB family regulatory protein